MGIKKLEGYGLEKERGKKNIAISSSTSFELSCSNSTEILQSSCFSVCTDFWEIQNWRFCVLLDFENLGNTCIYFKLLILSDLKEIECKRNTE